jgi:hypothetical protein
MAGVNFALKHANDFLQKHTDPTTGGELLIGGGLLSIFGGVALKGMLGKAAEEGTSEALKKEFIAKFGRVPDLASGIMVGKALSGIGIQPVFVVNMPSGLGQGPGGASATIAEEAESEAPAAEGAAGGFALTKLGSIANYLRGAWTMASGADLGALIELGGAEALGLVGAGVGAAGLAGYGAGTGLSWGLSQFELGRDFNNGLGHVLAAGTGDDTADIAAADALRLHRLTKLPFGADGGAPRLSTVVSDYDAAERGDPLASRQAISDALGAALGQSGRNAADVTAPVHQVDLTISFDQAGLPLIRSVKQSKDSKVKVNPAAGILGFGG